MLKAYIRANIDDFTELALHLRQNGRTLRYLPKYYPECNPIELVWAYIKQEYKKTDSKLPWRQRLDLAHEGVTEDQIEKCFDKSIRYCLDRLMEFNQCEDVHRVEKDYEIIDDADNEEWMEEEEDQ